MIAGVDGCRAGWVVAQATAWPCPQEPEIVVLPTFAAVLDHTRDCRMVMVDMPIGLASGRATRLCDEQARHFLGPSCSRLFPAPPRECLPAATSQEFQALHRQHQGKGASLPLWGIIPKIREVDACLHPAEQDRVQEFHPELAWAWLTGRVLSTKHALAGLEERCQVLQQHAGPWAAGLTAASLPRFRRTQRDDVLDALVGLSAA